MSPHALMPELQDAAVAEANLASANLAGTQAVIPQAPVLF